MDGIFIAFHNTAQIQGFQYINLADMDKRLFGDPGVGDAVFRMCVGLLEKVNEAVKKCFPSKVSTCRRVGVAFRSFLLSLLSYQSIKVIYDTAKTCSSMSVWVEPLNWDKNTPAPATEFTVTIQHYSDGQRISKPQFGDPHCACQLPTIYS
jgi:Mitochondrial protein Pet127